MPASASDLLPQDTSAAAPDPKVIQGLLQACEELKANDTERLALFQAAIVASNLRNDRADDDRLGVLGQNAFWGPAPARRDPRTAAEVFLREARRLRESGGPRFAARLAVRVQGGGSVLRHRMAGRAAKHILTDTGAPAPVVEAVPAVAPLAADV
ncbi:MAG TPA: hypothetical protein VGJ14_03760 [Sporichthyaceae bacterium]|jgi:hypothetical protein